MAVAFHLSTSLVSAWDFAPIALTTFSSTLKEKYFLPLLRFAAVLPTNDQVPIENVIVAESGDDSDDEWNYIKVDKSTTKSDKASPEPERIEEAEDSKPVLEDSVEDTATPPTASIGEPDIIASQVLEEDTDVSIHADGHPQLTQLFYPMVCNFVFFFVLVARRKARDGTRAFGIREVG